MNETTSTEDAPARRGERAPKKHRTIDRVTHILEQVVYHPGITFAEIVRSSGAAKSSIYGFVSGLLANGWLYEEKQRFYLGPAAYGLTMASGHIRAGMVTHADLEKLQGQVDLAVFLGVQAGDNLFYVEEAASERINGFEARSNIRRTLIGTAGGKVLLAARPYPELEAYLRRQSKEDAAQVDQFLAEYEDIRASGFAINQRRNGGQLALAAAVRNRAGQVVASVILVGNTTDMEPRIEELKGILSKHIATWAKRQLVAREAV
jgi:DNA-binding IclR family transcriptional regulator